MRDETAYDGGEEVLYRQGEGAAEAPPAGIPEPVAPRPGRPARRRPRRAGAAGLGLGIARPPKMTIIEFEKHRREGHAVYHPGCKHCVAARAPADQHRRNLEDIVDVDTEEGNPERVPTVSGDFCFPGSKGERLTVFVSADSKSRKIFAHPCPDKATVSGEHSQYLVDSIVNDLNSLAYPKTIFKTDGEDSCKALQNRVQRARHKETLLENSPKGDSQSNGDAEKAVQDFEGTFRAQRASLEADIGARIPLDHPIAYWMVENVADCINRFRPRGGKQTALQRHRGLQSPKRMADFGESILYLPAKDDRRPVDKADHK